MEIGILFFVPASHTYPLAENSLRHFFPKREKKIIAEEEICAVFTVKSIFQQDFPKNTKKNIAFYLKQRKLYKLITKKGELFYGYGK